MADTDRKDQSPRAAIDKSAKAAPGATRFLYAGYAVLAMAAVVLSWNRAPGALIGVAAIIVALATIISLLTYGLSRTKFLPAIVCLWAVLLVTMGAIGLFFSSLFFGAPERGALFVARLLGDSQLAILKSADPGVLVGSGQTILPQSASVPPTNSEDQLEKIAALSKLPPTTVRGTSIQINSPALYFGVLRLQDATFETSGKNVRIEAVRIEAAGNALIRSAVPPAGREQVGSSGGNLTLIVYDGVSGQLAVDLSGGTGGTGADGRAGAKGAGGSPGDNAASSLVDCKHGGGPGGRGGPGTPGEDGHGGKPGGDGGNLVLQAPHPDRIAGSITFTSKGGIGGAGGAAGRGGPGGDGGPGGHGGGYCGGGQAGPSGPAGLDGKAGAPGPSGKDGSMSKLSL